MTSLIIHKNRRLINRGHHKRNHVNYWPRCVPACSLSLRYKTKQNKTSTIIDQDRSVQLQLITIDTQNPTQQPTNPPCHSEQPPAPNAPSSTPTTKTPAQTMPAQQTTMSQRHIPTSQSVNMQIEPWLILRIE